MSLGSRGNTPLEGLQSEGEIHSELRAFSLYRDGDESISEPKVLACLHVFGKEKLLKLLEESKQNGFHRGIICPECSQETLLNERGVDGLLDDYVLANMLDIAAIRANQVQCTCCKTKDLAVARCNDCPNFLCRNCHTAHTYMRLFEGHKIVTFDEMLGAGESLEIHRPIYCKEHKSESLRYFCNTCQIPICNECMVSICKGHNYQRIADTHLVHEELSALVKEGRERIGSCEDAAAGLDSLLSDLQMQRDNTRDLIQETYQTYRAILEKRKECLLRQLDDIQSKIELRVMETCQSVGKTIEKIEDGCKFADRVIKHGNTLEVLSMKKLIASQLTNVANSTPKFEMNVSFVFKTDEAHFREAVEEGFGQVMTEAKEEPELRMSSRNSLEGEGFQFNTFLPPVSTTEFIPPNMQKEIQSLAESIRNIQLQQTDLIGLNGLPPDRCPSQTSDASGMSELNPDIGNQNLLNMIKVASQFGDVPSHFEPGLSLGTSTGMGSPVDAVINNMMNGSPGASAASSVSTPFSDVFRSQTPHFDDYSSSADGYSVRGDGSTTRDFQLANGTSFPPGSSFKAPANGALPPGRNFPLHAFPGGGNLNPPVRHTSKMTPMQIKIKFGSLGPVKGQFNSPHGFCLGLEQEIIVADTNNHRVQVFAKNGEFMYQFGVPGREEGQMWYPRKVCVMKSNGKVIICDRGNERSRMQIFTKTGHFLKKIAIRYIDIVAGLAVTDQGHIVAVDSVSPTVFCIAETGDLIRWFDCSDYMREPSDLAISKNEYFVCDFKGHCVVVFTEEGQFLRRIGCENITNFPNGIDISDAGDVLVGDSHGNRFHVAVFSRDGQLIAEFECPYCKVSRCCGLKITSEGYVVTLAKNNHHVLVLNTLYIS